MAEENTNTNDENNTNTAVAETAYKKPDLTKPQSPDAKDKPRSKNDPVNWAAHGINTEAFGKKSGRKQATDTAPTDVSERFTPKLPPQVSRHNEEGEKTGEHSMKDRRFDDGDLKRTVEDESSVDKSTPTDSANLSDEDKANAKKLEEERANKEAASKQQNQSASNVDQSTNKPSNNVPNSNRSSGAGNNPSNKPSKNSDPALKVR